MTHSTPLRAISLLQGFTEKTAVALESASGPTQEAASPTPVLPGSDAVDITQQGSTYYVTLNSDRFDSYSDFGRSFLVWLHTRAETDTIILTTCNCGAAFYVPDGMLYNTTLFQALAMCPATLVGDINSTVLGHDAYVYMTCDELIIGPYALLMIVPLWSGSANNQSLDQAVCLDFVHKLYEKAVDLQLLTKEEVALLCDGQSVTLFPQSWSDASYEHLTLHQETAREHSV